MDAQKWSSPEAGARAYSNPSQPWSTRGAGYAYQGAASPQSRRRLLAMGVAIGALAFFGGEGLLKLGDAAFRLLS